MKAILLESKRHEILIDIQGENPAERVLLAHLQDRHVSILCPGPYAAGAPGPMAGYGVRLFIRNVADFEIREQVEKEIEAKLNRKKRRRR